MGGNMSHRRRSSRRHMYSHYPASLPPPEDVFIAYYLASSYPVSPTFPVGPMDQMDADPYFQYAGFSGAMRRFNSDPDLFGYDPYMQYGVAQGNQWLFYHKHLIKKMYYQWPYIVINIIRIPEELKYFIFLHKCSFRNQKEKNNLLPTVFSSNSYGHSKPDVKI